MLLAFGNLNRAVIKGDDFIVIYDDCSPKEKRKILFNNCSCGRYVVQFFRKAIIIKPDRAEQQTAGVHYNCTLQSISRLLIHRRQLLLLSMT